MRSLLKFNNEGFGGKTHSKSRMINTYSNAKKYTKNYRDNNIHPTSLHLLFSNIVHVLMLTPIWESGYFRFSMLVLLFKSFDSACGRNFCIISYDLWGVGSCIPYSYSKSKRRDWCMYAIVTTIHVCERFGTVIPTFPSTFVIVFFFFLPSGQLKVMCHG